MYVDNFSYYLKHVCPSCGYCPCCGRRNYTPPWQYPPSQPYWYSDPHGTWVGTPDSNYSPTVMC